MGIEQRDLPRNVSDLVEQFGERRTLRRLHELGEQGITMVVEAAAIRAGNVEAENAARDLRSHLMQGGQPETFLSKYPGHQKADFSGLDLETTFSEMVQSSTLLLPTRSEKETHRPRISGGDGRGAISLRGEGGVINTLFETYPTVKEIFEDETKWVKVDGREYLERAQIQKLLVSRKPGAEMALTSKLSLINDLWRRWRVHNADKGGRLAGHGPKLFVERSEAIDFLWFIHQQILRQRSPTRGFSLAQSQLELAKKK